MHHFSRSVLAAGLVVTGTMPLAAQAPTDEAILAKARAIHAKVFSVDTHVDISPANFTSTGPNYTQKLPRTQVDLVKMEEGGLSGAFLIVYVGQAAQLDSAGFARAQSGSWAHTEPGAGGQPSTHHHR